MAGKNNSVSAAFDQQGRGVAHRATTRFDKSAPRGAPMGGAHRGSASRPMSPRPGYLHGERATHTRQKTLRTSRRSVTGP